jgi:transcription initiation factor TFIID subunit 2
VHEADGTPYEHIAVIEKSLTKFEIPYNTKYKRLKRSKLQKEREAAAEGLGIADEGDGDVLTYCLGDTLQSDKEVRDWHLAGWSKEQESEMEKESYEWIRVDKDFEWICKIEFDQPIYMYVSQLQQDNDVVAQMLVRIQCFTFLN